MSQIISKVEAGRLIQSIKHGCLLVVSPGDIDRIDRSIWVELSIYIGSVQNTYHTCTRSGSSIHLYFLSNDIENINIICKRIEQLLCEPFVCEKAEIEGESVFCPIFSS